MGRHKMYGKKAMHIYMDASVSETVKEILQDPFTSKMIYGAFGKYITLLVRNDLNSKNPLIYSFRDNV